MDVSFVLSHYGDDATVADSLPGQAQHQGMQLLSAELVLPVYAGRWPHELALVESPGRQPDANAVMHKHLHSVGAAVGEQVSVVRMRCTEHLNHPAKCRIRARAHVQWLYCQPGAVDSNHLRTDADQQAKSLAADMGQVTVMTRPPLRTSTLISRSCGSAGFVRSGNAMNDGAF